MWHLSQFQPSEMIEIAVQVEQIGASFYRKLAGKVDTDKVKEALLFLAAEEDKHQAEFTKLGADFEPVNPRESYAGEYYDYVRSTVETHMFSDEGWMEAIIASAKCEADIIRLAASFEKDSILFFQSFKSLVDVDKQPVVDQLIKEEESHLVKLANIIRELK